jgi:hypothetical protein
VTIDGWRTSLSEVAAFRFSSVRDSYAGRTGQDRNVGVIGVAFFRERPRPAPTWRPRYDISKGPVPSAPPASQQAPAARSASPSAASADTGSGAAGGAAAQNAPRAEAKERPGLGTEFGEAHSSYVEEVTFARADASPMAVTQVFYDDERGLIARGIPVHPRDTREADIDLRESAQPFPGRFAQPPP